MAAGIQFRVIGINKMRDPDTLGSCFETRWQEQDQGRQYEKPGMR